MLKRLFGFIKNALLPVKCEITEIAENAETAENADCEKMAKVQIEDTNDAIIEVANGFRKTGIAAETAEDALADLQQHVLAASVIFYKEMEAEAQRRREKRQNTNNWRKMHGLPMRRRHRPQKKAK
ncbi:hypothetical protein [Phascolarctobacterium sp.]|uniref:hypothetical protein n=1 Tax=Phascolarctobacterium sp. TaxID=2049039 RepID=UPI003869A536